MLKTGLGAPWARNSFAVPEKRGRDWEAGLLNCLQDPFGGNEAWDRPWSIADFKIEKKLHTAKASSVYSAKEASTGTPVIIKVYYKEKLSPLNKGQVERERRIHGALRHPNIVRLFTAFEDEASIYLVMEQASQGDLFMKMCAATEHFSEKQIVSEFLHPLLLSLDQLHTLGILHRDIKPENLLICGDGTLKLADFGLAVDRREERPITRAGTLDYMAPEVLLCPDKTRPEQNKHLADLEYGTAVDIWAVGILAFELLVGRAPFARDTPRETYDSILSHDPAIPAHLPPNTRAFLAATLSKDPRERPSVNDLLQHPWVLQYVKTEPAPALALRQAAGLGTGAARLLNKSFSIGADAARYGHSAEAPKPAELIGEMSALSCDVMALRGGAANSSMAATAAAALQTSAASASAMTPLRVRPPAMGAPRLPSRSNSRRMYDVAQPAGGSLLASLTASGALQPTLLAHTQPLPEGSSRAAGVQPGQGDALLHVAAAATAPRGSILRASLGGGAPTSQPAQQPQKQPGFLAKIFSSPAKQPAPVEAAPQLRAPSVTQSTTALPRLSTQLSSQLSRADTCESAHSYALDSAREAAGGKPRARLDDNVHNHADRSVRSLASEFASAQSIGGDAELLGAEPSMASAWSERPAGLDAMASARSLYTLDAPAFAVPKAVEPAAVLTPTPPQPQQPTAPVPPHAAASPAAKLGGRARALLTRLSSRRSISVAQYGEDGR